MAKYPDALRFTPAEQAELDRIRTEARQRHEWERKRAAKRGRKDFPLLPYECSWAYEQEFRKAIRQTVF